MALRPAAARASKLPPAMPIVSGALARVFAVPEHVNPSQWAAANMNVPDGPRAGSRWDASLTPYVPEIIDALGPDSDHNFAVVRKSTQTGVTVAGIALVGTYIDRAPTEIGYALPTVDLVAEFNRDKLTPTIDQSPALRRKVRAQISRSGEGSTAKSKRFPGGSLSLINANSAADLKLRSLKVGVADEIDTWADSLGDDGDPFRLFRGRFISYHATGEWRLLALSVPKLVGTSRIDGLYLAGDQRFWFVDCPGCGEAFRFEFRNLKFNRTPPYEAHYVAPCCGAIVEHHQKAALVRAGRFVATRADGLYPSFHVDALISLLTTWDHLADEWWSAQGDPQKERTFFNEWLGLPYEMRGDAPDYERLLERREDYADGAIPASCLLVTAGVDVQHSGLWYEVVGFAADKQSWSIDAGFIAGDTTDPGRGAWKALDELYDRKLPDAFGAERGIDAIAVDAGDGGRADAVYGWCRARHRAHAIAGRPGWQTPAIGTPTRVDVTVKGKKRRKGALLWPIGTWSLKGTWYANLRKVGKRAGAEADPPGYCHFGRDRDEGYFRQVTAEFLAAEKFKGRLRQIWKVGPWPNHLLDCRVYAMAMAERLGLTRNTPDQWQELARLRGVPAEIVEADLFDGDAERVAAAPVRRRRGRSNLVARYD